MVALKGGVRNGPCFLFCSFLTEIINLQSKLGLKTCRCKLRIKPLTLFETIRQFKYRPWQSA